jgi:hypothetical protein
MCQGTQRAKLKTGGQQSLHAVVQEGLLVQGIGEKDMAEGTGGAGWFQLKSQCQLAAWEPHAAVKNVV